MNLKRIDKIAALNCNMTRKEARQAIKSGNILINGRPVLKAEELVDCDSDTITVNGEKIELKEHIYIVMNKPKGVITATEDKTKQTVIDLIPKDIKRRSLFPCGRLDRDTTGLLVITDDGALAHRLMSPSHHVYKTYAASLLYEAIPSDIDRLEKGITLEDGTECLPARAKIIDESGTPLVHISIKEGKYHQVKRMFAALGNKVIDLKRLSIGAFTLPSDLKEGDSRLMTGEEVDMLFTDTAL